jgi:molybdopterin molybdotransferase
VEEALRRARARAVRPGAEWVPLAGLAGRRLAAPVVAGEDLPAGDCSAMDGWALRNADPPPRYRVVGESAAGRPLRGALRPGEACRISTGAPLPPGADAVVKREDGRERGRLLVVADPPRPWAHVRRRGEDLAGGRAVLDVGVTVAAHEVAVVAGAGHSGAMCRRRPRVSILTTGDELVPHGAARPPGAVVDSNRAGLAAQAEAAGASVHESAHAPDDRLLTRAALAGLLEGAGAPPDLVVTVGGISVGAHDHVGPALESLGARWVLRGVAVRPGHPVGIALSGGVAVLALPGNPAAAAVCFHLLGRPLLGVPDDWCCAGTLRGPIARHARATLLVRCAESVDGLLPLERQGSAELSSLAGARALAWIDAGAGTVPAGATVRASRLP